MTISSVIAMFYCSKTRGYTCLEDKSGFDVRSLFNADDSKNIRRLINKGSAIVNKA